ncbi:MAG: C_GCAxxG_C_C family protein [Butyricicoccus pullicaecorum]|nr:C_GCAxxG_C_C family protein [Butyricicoccus pullicaecorum]
MESRVQKAIDLHHKGYNCAQAVVCAYCDLFGLDEETGYRASEAFGFGMGQMEVCGALAGACILAGLKNSGGLQAVGKTKAETYKLDRQLAAAFREKNQSVLCRELKGVESGKVLRSCDGCVEDGARLVETYLLG